MPVTKCVTRPSVCSQISRPVRVVVRQRVRLVRVLVGIEVLPGVLVDDLAAQPDGAVGALHRVGEDQLGAVRLGDLAPRPRHVARHHQRHRVAQRAADQRIRDAGVAAGRIDDGLAGRERARCGWRRGSSAYAARSLTEPPGLKNSHFAHSSTPGVSRSNVCSRTMGVSPIRSVIRSATRMRARRMTSSAAPNSSSPRSSRRDLLGAAARAPSSGSRRCRTTLCEPRARLAIEHMQGFGRRQRPREHARGAVVAGRRRLDGMPRPSDAPAPNGRGARKRQHVDDVAARAHHDDRQPQPSRRGQQRVVVEPGTHDEVARPSSGAAGRPGSSTSPPTPAARR